MTFLSTTVSFYRSEKSKINTSQSLNDIISSIFSHVAAVAPSAHSESPDETAGPADAPTESEEGNHLPEQATGNGDEGRETEFSCGSEAKTGGEERELGGGSVCARGGGGASELHQYDGILPEEGGAESSQNGLDCFLPPRVPAVTVMDRLTEMHGSAALSFSSALAAQVAARSHSLVNMEEQTFGDDGEEDDGDEDEEEEEEEVRDRRRPDKD